ncbi:hypothetical protein H5V45_04850 [Nocardioides sp. KIGAM211]|uniref:Uncharacterized protein n=1 Tax=Nocardioides luti TaxID=2761101 RepID=A0A7X0RE76_9ACTN|nr:hypothetical protein [Nocardioides luti]MBB6626646.1 hypothetical protein [Nocardioides luti]
MSEPLEPTAAPVPGRSAVLAPLPVMKPIFGVVAGLFTLALLYQPVYWLRGEVEWGWAYAAQLAALVLIAAATIVGAAAAWTNRTWVDTTDNTLHQRFVGREQVISLDEPTTAELTYKPPSFNASLSGTWKVLVRRQGELTMSVSTPWVADITDVLRILQPSLARNPGLPKDDRTREALASLTTPSLRDHPGEPS